MAFNGNQNIDLSQNEQKTTQVRHTTRHFAWLHFTFTSCGETQCRTGKLEARRRTSVPVQHNFLWGMRHFNTQFCSHATVSDVCEIITSFTAWLQLEESELKGGRGGLIPFWVEIGVENHLPIFTTPEICDYCCSDLPRILCWR